MVSQNRTWKLRWTVLALIAAFALGAATLTDAQERRTVAEIQADIDKLQAELREAQAAERATESNNTITRHFTLRNVTADSLVHNLRSLVPPVDTPLQLTVDARNNRIIAIGSREDVAIVEVLVNRLDRHPSEIKIIKVFQFEHADAHSLTEMLRTLVPTGSPAIFAADSRTNSIIVAASQEVITIVGVLLKRLDVPSKTQSRASAE